MTDSPRENVYQKLGLETYFYKLNYAITGDE